MLLWDVDTQVDFLTPGGLLYVPGSESIIPNLAQLTAFAQNNRLPLISSTDAHHSGDPELEIYGPHCMAGTHGQEKVPETVLPNRYLVPNRLVELQPLQNFQQIVIEKQQFDVFTNPNTNTVLHRFGPALEIVIYGVVTEICVAVAARNLLARGHRLAMVSDAIYALDTAKAAGFIDEFLAAGGQLVTTDEATSRKHTVTVQDR